MTDPTTENPDHLPVECRARYRAVRLLGRGGFGRVYLAEQMTLGRLVAVKVLGPSVLEGDETRERFLEEARITSALRHPGIVQLIECGISQDRPWIVFEYLEASALEGQGRRTEAIRGFSRAAWLAPHDMWIMTDSGRCLRDAGRFAESDPLLARAGEHARTIRNLSCVYWKQLLLSRNAQERGDRLAAEDHLRQDHEARSANIAVDPGLSENKDVQGTREFFYER